MSGRTHTEDGQAELAMTAQLGTGTKIVYPQMVTHLSTNWELAQRKPGQRLWIVGPDN